jgi:hypothetical protein
MARPQFDCPQVVQHVAGPTSGCCKGSRSGHEPDIVCGTSMGALVGAAYVTGRLPLNDWARANGKK